MASFKKRVHHVKGDLSYIRKSFVLTEIAEPSNSIAVNYYSILNDESSSAKTNDEKEIFLIKTGATGVPKFEVMSLHSRSPEARTAPIQRGSGASPGKIHIRMCLDVFS